MTTIERFRHRVFGRQLKTKDSPHQTISKTVGLAVFASDSLSSVAYAGGEILLILAVLGAAGAWLAIPITVAIAGLLILLTLSYRQTIFAYPSGGGAYIVARDNFGIQMAQVAGAALLIDYILTVSVSVASGVDQIASMFPVLFTYKVQIALLLVLFITYMNLRGVKESGTVFAVPTYFFVLMILLLIGSGLWQWFSGALGTVGEVAGAEHTTQNLTGLAFAFLLLRAFSSGTTALTGVEAISNGITAFKEPKSRNAAITLVWDAALLMLMFLGLGVLGFLVGAQPSESEVLISQIARTVYGEGIMRFLTLLAATIILIMAANTSFADFPRLAALQAGDNFLPRQFGFRSSRLVFNWGIIILAACASLLIYVFAGSVSRLIPLYAIGVFVCFTLSQAGMARRWRTIGTKMATGELTPTTPLTTRASVLHYDPHWRQKMYFNGFGAVVTAIVAVIFLLTKFTHGAWVVMLLIPAFVWLFDRIHTHYLHVAQVLSTAGERVSREKRRIKTLVLVGDVHRETMLLVEFANSLGVEWTPVHVAVYPERVPEIQKKWRERVGLKPLEIIEAPYRGLIYPVRTYVKKLLRAHPDTFVHVIIGELNTGNPMSQILHQNAHRIEQGGLRDLEGVVTTIVPLQLEAYDKKESEH
jgi:amino acid transporter